MTNDVFVVVLRRFSDATYAATGIKRRDFQSWVNLQTNSVVGHLLEFADPNAWAYPHRFYRAIVCDSVTGLRIGTITQLADGQVQFDFSGVSGRSYLIQASTNLIQWENVRTNVGASGPIVFTDSVKDSPHRFYRVRLGP